MRKTARARARTATIAVSLALASLALTALAAPAASSAATNGAFTCNASVLRILGIDLSSLLGSGDPCRDAHGGIEIPLSAGNRIYVLRGVTTTAGGVGSANASVLDLSVISSSLLPVALLRSSAYVTCRAGKPTFSAGSNTIEGLQTLVTAPFNAPKSLAIGSLIFVNETVADSTGITQRALRVATPLGDVVLAETRAGVSRNPCARVHKH